MKILFQPDKDKSFLFEYLVVKFKYYLTQHLQYLILSSLFSYFNISIIHSLIKSLISFFFTTSFKKISFFFIYCQIRSSYIYSYCDLLLEFLDNFYFQNHNIMLNIHYLYRTTLLLQQTYFIYIIPK